MYLPLLKWCRKQFARDVSASLWPTYRFGKYFDYEHDCPCVVLAYISISSSQTHVQKYLIPSSMRFPVLHSLLARVAVNMLGRLRHQSCIPCWLCQTHVCDIAPWNNSATADRLVSFWEPVLYFDAQYVSYSWLDNRCFRCCRPCAIGQASKQLAATSRITTPAAATAAVAQKSASPFTPFNPSNLNILSSVSDMFSPKALVAAAAAAAAQSTTPSFVHFPLMPSSLFSPSVDTLKCSERRQRQSIFQTAAAAAAAEDPNQMTDDDPAAGINAATSLKRNSLQAASARFWIFCARAPKRGHWRRRSRFAFADCCHAPDLVPDSFAFWILKTDITATPSALPVTQPCWSF